MHQCRAAAGTLTVYTVVRVTTVSYPNLPELVEYKLELVYEMTDIVYLSGYIYIRGYHLYIPKAFSNYFIHLGVLVSTSMV